MLMMVIQEWAADSLEIGEKRVIGNMSKTLGRKPIVRIITRESKDVEDRMIGINL